VALRVRVSFRTVNQRVVVHWGAIRLGARPEITLLELVRVSELREVWTLYSCPSDEFRERRNQVFVRDS